MHPYIFKTTNAVSLPKTGEKDLLLSKSDRPVALLSYLGKSLGRITACRISYWEFQFKILVYDQCSAISRRLAIDLATALHCDIRAALEKITFARIFTLDVKGIFHGKLFNRLVLKKQTKELRNYLVVRIEYSLSGRPAPTCLCRKIHATTNTLWPSTRFISITHSFST